MTELSRERLLQELHRLNARLRLDGTQLSVQAPRGALTPAVFEALAYHKEWLVTKLGLNSHSAEVGARDLRVLDDQGARIERALLALPGTLRANVARASEHQCWRAQVVVDAQAIDAEAVDVQAAVARDPQQRWQHLTWSAEAVVAQLRIAEAEQLCELEAVHQILNRLAVVAIALVMRRLQCFDDRGSRETAESIVKRCGLEPRYRVVMDQWLNLLAAAGYVKCTDAGYDRGTLEPASVLQGKLDALCTEAGTLGAHPALVDHIVRCAAAQIPLLRGELDPFDLLFPQGRFELAYAHYRDGPISRISNHLVAQLCAVAIDHGHFDGAPTVLEIGAGSAATTETIIGRLRGRPLHYLFTDVGEFFLRRARERFCDLPALKMECRVLDVNEHPLLQGYAPQSVDVLVAVNVLHTAVEVEAALMRLRGLLKPGGILLLGEHTEQLPLHCISFAHFESFGHYRDHRVHRNSPLMPADEWERALATSGFTRYAAFPAAASRGRDLGMQCVLVAEAPTETPRFTSKTWLAAAREAMQGLGVSVELSACEQHAR
nr:methyltransferase [uncultured Caldimonas sp.]